MKRASYGTLFILLQQFLFEPVENVSAVLSTLPYYHQPNAVGAAVYGGLRTVVMSEEERRRSEAALQQLTQQAGDVMGVGARLLGKMGFGAAEGSKGGLGRNEQV